MLYLKNGINCFQRQIQVLWWYWNKISPLCSKLRRPNGAESSPSSPLKHSSRHLSCSIQFAHEVYLSATSASWKHYYSSCAFPTEMRSTSHLLSHSRIPSSLLLRYFEILTIFDLVITPQHSSRSSIFKLTPSLRPL